MTCFVIIWAALGIIPGFFFLWIKDHTSLVDFLIEVILVFLLGLFLGPFVGGTWIYEEWYDIK